MIGNLNGIIAFLLFTAMGGLAVLIFLVSLIIKFIGKNHFLFLKFAYVSLTFFAIGLGGFLLSVNFDGTSTAKLMDNYVCWTFLIIAVVISVFILSKKEKKPPANNDDSYSY